MKPGNRHLLGTAAGVAAILAVAATMGAVAIATGARDPGRVQAIMFAAGISLFAGLGGWLAERARPPSPGLAVAATLGAICIRVFPLLASLAWLRESGGRLYDDGAAGWLLVFYLAILATDVLLHIMWPSDGRGGGSAAKI